MKSKVELLMPPGWADVVEKEIFNAVCWHVIQEEMHAHADFLAELEQYNITARTPEDTGALRSDLKTQYDYVSTSKTLARIYFDTANQLDEYDRVYMLYQEGGELGLATYTNPPREMVARALTEDVDAIVQWGNEVLAMAADRIAAGKFSSGVASVVLS